MMGNNPLFDVTAEEVPASITQEEWNDVRAQIADVHTFVTQLAGFLGQAGKNPVMRSMLPPGLAQAFGG